MRSVLLDVLCTVRITRAISQMLHVNGVIKDFMEILARSLVL